MSDERLRSQKARAVLIDADGKTVIANYNGCLMFPGGKIDSNETSKEALQREIKEELGIVIDKAAELFLTSRSRNSSYTALSGGLQTKKTTSTDYFRLDVNNIELGSAELSDKEKAGGFALELVAVDDLRNLAVNHQTDNLRWPIFRQEMLRVIDHLEGASKDE